MLLDLCRYQRPFLLSVFAFCINILAKGFIFLEFGYSVTMWISLIGTLISKSVLHHMFRVQMQLLDCGAVVMIEGKDTGKGVQILDEAIRISHSVNSLGKGMHPIILPQVGQTGFSPLAKLLECSPMARKTGINPRSSYTSLLNTQHYKVWIKCKVEQSRERSMALPYNSV